jgi:hypothetical protein
MLRVGAYEFKQAESEAELDQIHRLNYRTFVQEIPQHHDNGTGALVDRFHDKNTYLICLREGRLIGMMAASDQPPFSVTSRLPDPTLLTQPGIRPLEVRLLAIDGDERHSLVFIGLVWSLRTYAKTSGATHFVMSGVEEQQDLYKHMGFTPLGPGVGTGRACYVPMWATLEDVDTRLERTIRLFGRRLGREAKNGTGNAREDAST